MMADVDIGMKTPETFPFAIWETLLVGMGEVVIRPRSATLPPITQVTMLHCLVYLVLIAIWMIVFMKMKEAILGTIM